MPMMPRRTLAVAVAGLLAQGATGLYADEVGKLDWHRQNLGRFESAAFDGRGGVTVVGEASTIASVNSRTGELTWRQVLSPEDNILATSAPSTRTPATATVSSGGRIVRLWSPVDGSMMWETALGVGDPASTEAMEAVGESAGVVSTERGYVVVLSAGGIHVLQADTGAVLAQWWCEPAREPDLAALVGLDVQVAFTSLRLVSGGDGRLLAGGWSKKKGAKEADAFVIAEINPSERLVTFKAAKVSDFGVDPSAGVTLAHTHGGCGGDKTNEKGLAVVGLSGDGSALFVFPAASDPPLAARAALPSDIRGATGAVTSVTDLVGTGGGLLELRQGGGGSVAVSLSSDKGAGACAISGLEGAKEARLCAGGEAGGGCALAGGVSVSGKMFVASASMVRGAAGHKVIVSVTQVTEFGDFTAALVDSFEASSPALAGGASGRIEEAFLEVGEGPFRVLVVNEDDSAMMVGVDGVDWVREEGLAAVDQVAFVDSSKDELSILAASAGEEIEHDVPGWKERLRLHRLELTAFVGKSLQIATGLRLPGSEVLDTADTSHSAFGLKKLAICTTNVGKIYALDMADGSVAWSLFRPSWIPAGSKVLLYATRNKAALGYSPEVAVIAIGESKTVVAALDALTGLETYREEFDVKVASAVPLGVKDGQERRVIMLVDSDKLIRSVPSTPEASSALRGLLPQLFYHDLSDEGLESFSVVEKGPKGSSKLGSAAVASLPFSPTRSKVVATAYPDRRDGVQTPAHTLGDDSLLIKYINPRLFAFATLSPEDAGSGEEAGGSAGDLNGRGQELTVTLVDYVSGRLLHRISHKGASEPVHMQVSESWVVYSYWSAISHRTEMSTLSLYEGMIDKYGLSPFNRPEWKEEFSSFESRVPIVLQKTFIFPLPVTALGITLTQYGITSKNILVGTAVGQVVSLDRRFLDPRRPQEEPTKAEKEEKLLQYQPYLPVVPTQVLSYYKVIERVNRVLTEPTGLESTSLVLALGLDLFGARVAPSKTYDMLDPNFNYALLVLPPLGRREADKLLVLLLQQNGCPIPEGVSSVGQLSSDAVIQAVGSMIAGISGSPPPPEALSTRGSHPAERYHACRLVASRVRDVGYAEPFSAHQLLYPGGEDTRALLLELLSMLPPEGALPLPAESASRAEHPPLSGQDQQQADDPLSTEPRRDAEGAEMVALAATSNGGNNNNDAPSPPPKGGEEGQEGEGGAVADTDEAADSASGGGEGEGEGDEEGKYRAGSDGSNPGDVSGSAPEDTVMEEKETGEAGEAGEAQDTAEALSPQGPQEETPPVAAVHAASEASGSVQGADAVDGDDAGEEREQEEPAGWQVEHGEAVAKEQVISAESIGARVDGANLHSVGLDNLEHGEEPGEAGIEEEEEEDNVLGPGTTQEALVEEPAAVEASTEEHDEEEDNVFGPGPTEEVPAEEPDVVEAFTGEPEEEEDTVFGPAPTVETPAEEPDVVEAFTDEPEEEEDNVFGPGPSVEALVDEPAAAEDFIERAEEEEDNVFGLTEPSEAVLGAKAAAREAFQDGQGQEEEGRGVEPGPTEQSSAVSPGVVPAPTGPFTEEEEEEGDKDNEFGPTEPSDVPLVTEPRVTESPKGEEEVLAVTTTEEAEERSAAGNGEPFPTRQAATAAAATEGPAEILAPDSQTTPVVGGRDADVTGGSGAPDAEGAGDAGPSLEAPVSMAEGPSNVQTAGVVVATKESTGIPDSGASSAAPLEGDDGHDNRTDGDNGKRTVDNDVDGAPDHGARMDAGSGAEKGAPLSDEGEGVEKGGDAVHERNSVQLEESAEGGAGPSGVKFTSGEGRGEGGEDGGEGRHEGAAHEDGEDDVVFLQFEVEAKELELKRILAEEEVDTKAANELEEEVRRLGSLAEEQEKYCRYTAKALELLPNVTTETRSVQLQCDAAEARIQAARKAFDKTRKPLEAVVRVQREELTRRKARCRALVEKMRGIYAECQEMIKDESSLKTAARDMEAWERMERGDMVIGREEELDDDGSSSGQEWGGDGDDEEDIRRRRAGGRLRMDIDKRITSLCENAAAQKQEIAISLSEVLDSRRDANSAWELLGRSEAMPEEKLFAAAKQAKSEGGGKANKERTKDLIDAYKRLHVLGDVFSQAVEAVSEVARREAECRLVEDETEKMLLRRGGINHLQLLSRDLKRVKEDAFELEKRLDQALEEDRAHHPLQGEHEDEGEHEHEHEHEREREQGQRRNEEEYGTQSVGDHGQAWNDKEVSFQAQQHEDAHGVPLVDQPHKYSADEMPVQAEEHEVLDDGRVGMPGAAHGQGVGRDVDEGSVGVASEDQEADFVGDDEEDNVWQ
eukprot:g18474.t1